MKVRYKKTGAETESSKFNIHAISEVLTGDDSPFISELDVWLPSKNEWKDMSQAFKDKDLIPDNYNVYFAEPKTKEDRERGYFL